MNKPEQDAPGTHPPNENVHSSGKVRDSSRPESTSSEVGKSKRLAASSDLSGHQLGDFRLIRRLGVGGMGEVYLAEQGSLKRQVALKVLRPHFVWDETYVERFAREAESAARLTHANIVQVYSFGQEGETSYLAMEYVAGKNLSQYVTARGPVNLVTALNIMDQVAGALIRAGSSGMVHRDIKPDNILLSKTGEVKVTDFGLARLLDETNVSLTQSGVTMGTPLYMSPEQVESRPLDPRSDLYSFGATSYFMLTGSPPFQADTGMAVALKHVQSAVRPLQEVRPDLPEELCRVVHRLLEKQLDHRYQDGRELQRDIRRIKQLRKSTPLRNQIDPPKPESLGRTFWQHVRLPFVSIGSLLLMFGLAVGVGRWSGGRQADVVKNELVWSYPNTSDVRDEKTALDQFRYAQVVGRHGDQEAAWAAVVERFPEDSTRVTLAQIQLAWCYLRNGQSVHVLGLATDMARSSDPARLVVAQVIQAAGISIQGDSQQSLDLLWDVVQNGTDLRKKTGVIEIRREISGLATWTLERNYRDLGRDWTQIDSRFRPWVENSLMMQRPGGGIRPQ